MNKNNATSLSRVARQVQRRLIVQRWFHALQATSLTLFTAAVGGMVMCRLTGFWQPGIPTAGAVVGVWLVATVLWAVLGRPSPVEAMAIWDQRANTDEMFLSGYCFERHLQEDVSRVEGDRTADGEALHLERTYRTLREEMDHVPKYFSLRPPVSALVMPVVFLALAATGLFLPPVSPDDLPVDRQARESAEEVGRDLEEAAEQLEDNEALTKEEQKKMKQLKESLTKTAKELENVEEETPRDVLKKLEQQARKAEKLAKSLGAKAASELSSAMLTELGRHADTAELASALRARDLPEIAKQAKKMAKKLKSKKLSLQQTQRIKRALQQSTKKATKADKQTLAGKHISGAARQMKRGSRKGAAKKFSRMSKKFRQLQRRRAGQKRVQRLAKRLRGAGHRIFGKKSGGVRRLAKKSGSGSGRSGKKRRILRRLMPRKGGGRMGKGNTKTFARAPRSSRPKGAGRAPIPGTGASRSGRKPSGGGHNPGSGTGKKPGSGMGGARGGKKPGSKSGAGRGKSPIPGSKPGSQGAPGGSSGGKKGGGQQAGTGTAPYTPKKTSPHKASRTDAVAPAASGSGESSVRARAGSPHSEETARKTSEVVLQKVRSQEAAIAEEPIPLTRREQVLRYFSALRRELKNDK